MGIYRVIAVLCEAVKFWRSWVMCYGILRVCIAEEGSVQRKKSEDERSISNGAFASACAKKCILLSCRQATTDRINTSRN
jgi:hypothetical protein